MNQFDADLMKYFVNQLSILNKMVAPWQVLRQFYNYNLNYNILLIFECFLNSIVHRNVFL